MNEQSPRRSDVIAWYVLLSFHSVAVLLGAVSFYLLGLFAVIHFFGSLILVGGLLFKCRWTRVFGVTIFLIRSLMGLYTFVLGVSNEFPGLSALFNLPILSIGSLIVLLAMPRSPYRGELPNPLKGSAKFLFPALSVVAAILISLAPLGLMFYSFSQIGKDYGGLAPSGTFAYRRAWGEKAFSAYAPHMQSWLTLSPIISANVGTPLEFAPLAGEENYYHSCFTDGCYARAAIEVTGPKGSGVLRSESIVVMDAGSELLETTFHEPIWTYQGNSVALTQKGNSSAAELGIDSNLNELSKFLSEGQNQLFIEKYEATTGIEKLPWEIQKPVRQHYAVALSALERPLDAANVYADIAEKELSAISNLLWDKRPDAPMLKRMEEVRKILLLLRQLTITDQKLSRRRNELENRFLEYNLFVAKGLRMYFQGHPEEIEEWGKKYLDWILKVGLEFAAKSSVVREDLGTVTKVLPDDAQNDIHISDGYYIAFVNLELIGSKGTGKLKMRIDESREDRLGNRLPAVEALAIKPREWGPQIRVREVEYTNRMGASLELSYSTGEKIPPSP